MSTPEEKLQAMADKAAADIAKAKSIWASWEVYIVAAVCLVLGAVIGHKL